MPCYQKLNYGTDFCSDTIVASSTSGIGVPITIATSNGGPTTLTLPNNTGLYPLPSPPPPIQVGSNISTLGTDVTSSSVGSSMMTLNQEPKMIMETYAWSGLNFVLYCVGIFILVGAGLLAFEQYTTYSRCKKTAKHARRMEWERHQADEARRNSTVATRRRK